MFWVLITVLLLTLVYNFGIKPLFYWKEHGVKQYDFPKVIVEAYFGIFKQLPSIEFVNYIYRQFPGSRYYGLYFFNQPSLLIKDVDLLKQMVIKDSDHFNEHRSFATEEADPMWANNLFSLKGNKWRRMRTTLSPSFTSSKMKGMFVLMQDAAEKFVTFFQDKNKDVIEIEAKDVFSRYCNDVIASTAFGIEVDSLADPTNQFFLYGKKVLQFGSYKTMFKIIFFMICPNIAKILNIKMIDTDVRCFFKKIIEDTIKMREEEKLVRHDMIHLLLEARKGNTKIEDNHDITDAGFATVEEHLKADVDTNITIDDIIAQALVFFFAGFDTSSSLMSFMAYELCVNQDIQDKLRNEIEETYEKYDNKLTYEALVSMKYMDMVVTESLRKWPVQAGMDRICTKPYVIQPSLPDEKPVRIEAGTPIGMPISGFHHDPKHFPNPEKFDPERFSDKNKGNIKQGAFQPFGLGPRNCIGSRFALLETKILFFYILKNFKIVPVDETDIPIKLKKTVFSTVARDGFNMGFKCL